jgi:hypothetical protein
VSDFLKNMKNYGALFLGPGVDAAGADWANNAAYLVHWNAPENVEKRAASRTRSELLGRTAEVAEVVNRTLEVRERSDAHEVVTAQAECLVVTLVQFPSTPYGRCLNRPIHGDIFRRAGVLAEGKGFLRITPVGIPDGGIAIQGVGGRESADLGKKQLVRGVLWRHGGVWQIGRHCDCREQR